MSEVHLIKHPMVQHKLSIMRQKETSTNVFRQLLREITVLMGYELTRDLPLLIAISAMLLFFGVNWRRLRENGVISRVEGAVWVLVFVVYMVVMVTQEISRNG